MLHHISADYTQVCMSSATHWHTQLPVYQVMMTFEESYRIGCSVMLLCIECWCFCCVHTQHMFMVYSLYLWNYLQQFQYTCIVSYFTCLQDGQNAQYLTLCAFIVNIWLQIDNMMQWVRLVLKFELNAMWRVLNESTWHLWMLKASQGLLMRIWYLSPNC